MYCSQGCFLHYSDSKLKLPKDLIQMPETYSLKFYQIFNCVYTSHVLDIFVDVGISSQLNVLSVAYLDWLAY